MNAFIAWEPFTETSIILGTPDRDRLRGSDLADRILGLGESDILYGREGGDRLVGNGFGDDLFGQEGHDVLYGGPDRDSLVGGPGHDKLVGGELTDDLTGGRGADLFVYRTASDAFYDGSDFDFIVDFEQGIDRIDLSGIDANERKPGDQAFRFVGAELEGEGELGYDAGLLLGNIAGNPASIFIEVDDLTKGDLIL